MGAESMLTGIGIQPLALAIGEQSRLARLAAGAARLLSKPLNAESLGEAGPLGCQREGHRSPTYQNRQLTAS